MGSLGGPILVRVDVPPAEALCCLTVMLNPKDARDPSAKSPYHWQIFKCRYLLFSAPFLASPVLGTERDILVVASREDFKSGILAGHLTRLNLQAGVVGDVTDAAYSACLRYTLQAHLGPAWNPLDTHLVQGRDFLVTDLPRNAVTLQVTVNGREGCAWLSVAASRVRVPRLGLADLEVSPPALERFRQDPVGTLPASTIGAPWVHVLPSMKRGMVMGVSKRIPVECPYQTYTDLRRHWKNAYGYRLPESEEGILYCQLFFQPLGWTLYSYPILCVSPHRPSLLRAFDPHAIVADFLRDVARKLPTVCGRPIVVCSTTVGHPVRGLHPAQLVQEERTPNLREEPLQPGRSHVYQRAQPSSQPSQSQNVPSSCPLSLATPAEGPRPAINWMTSTRQASPGKENEPPQDVSVPPSIQPLYRPTFRPTHRPNVTPTRRSLGPAFAQASSGSKNAPRPAKQPTARPGPLRPGVKSTPPPAQPAFLPLQRVSAAGRPNVLPTKPNFLPRQEVSTGCPSAPPNKPTVLPRQEVSAGYPSVLPNKPTNPPQETSAGRPGVPLNKPTFLPQETSAGRPGVPPNKSIFLNSIVPRPTPASQDRSATGKSAVKRAADGAGPVRAKRGPLQPTELTTEELVRKASVPVLLAWLRAKGLPCRAKDKKAELLDKVLQNFGKI